MYTSFLNDQNLMENNSSYRNFLRTVFLNPGPSNSVLWKGRIPRVIFNFPKSIFLYFDNGRSIFIIYNSVSFYFPPRLYAELALEVFSV